MEEGAKNVNPVWSRDGRSLLFVSNRGGIPNLYRVELESGELSRVTNFFTGISGIMDVSPAVSGARSEDRVLFTVYEAGSYNIYALTGADELRGDAAAEVWDADVADSTAVDAALLPPAPRPREATFNRV